MIAAMHGHLHGRAAETSALSAALAQVAGGGSRVVALVGEPGIGKTRLAQEASALAGSAGFTCASGRAWETGGAPAYWPWRLLMEALLGSLPPGPLQRLRGHAHQEAPEDPGQARFELFEAVAAALQAASSRSALLCVLEDLHAADLPSLELAAFATVQPSPRILWVLTWRDAEAERGPAGEILARIGRGAQRLALRPLDDAAAAVLIDESAGAVPPSLRENLVRSAGGNPLFLVETAAVLASSRRFAASLEQLPVAGGVAAVVRERMAVLPPAAARALQAGAVLGRELPLELWTVAAELPAITVRERAADIVAGGLAAELSPSCWSFRHDLVREAILLDVPRELASGAHARVARALDARLRGGEPGLAGARAHHALAAVDELGLPAALQWSIAAADSARAQCAYEEAMALLARAERVLGGAARRDGSFLLALARAHADLGQAGQARAAVASALEIGRMQGDARLCARAVLTSGNRYLLGDILHELVQLIDEAEATLPEDEVELRARLLARKAAALTPAARPEEALAMARRALALSAGSPDAGLRLDVAVAAGAALADFAHPRERVRVNEELVQLARSSGDRALELRGLTRLVTDHLEAGDRARADALIAEHEELASALKLARFAWTPPLLRSMRSMPDGAFEVCHRALDEAGRWVSQLDDIGAQRCLAVHRFWLYLMEDDVAGLVAHEPRLLEMLRTMNPTLRSIVRAAVRLRSGDLRSAREEVDAIDPALPHGAINALVLLAEVVAEVGPPELLPVIEARLAPFADTDAVWGPFGLTCGVPVSMALGQLAAAAGHAAEARRHLETALGRATAAGAGAQRAWVRHALGRALAAGGDVARSRAMLEAAGAEAALLGMKGLVQRCRSVEEPAAHPATFALRAQGDRWILERGGGIHLLPALRGLPMLARLLSAPDSDVPALELVAGEVVEDGDAGELLDARALAAYRRRAARLQESVTDAEELGRPEGAEAARDELEALRRELSRAVGLGGRVRRAGAGAERARVSAQRRIRQAIRSIAQVDPALAAYLERTVRTGYACSYRPRLAELPP